MPLDLPAAAPWRDLLSPVRPVIEAGLDRLALRPSRLPSVRPGSSDRVGLRPDGLYLDPVLLEAGPRVGEDAALAEAWPDLAPLALDRWRRAAGLILEGFALAAIAEELGGPAPRTWWTLGPAAEAVDRAAPELGWLWPEAAGFLRTPERSLDDAPRRAAWLVRWWRQQDRPWVIGERPALDPDAWTAFGAWLQDGRRGPAADAPVPLGRGPAARAADAAPPPPLAFRRVGVHAGPAGAVVRWPGGELRAAADEKRTGLAAGGPITQQDALPLGTWKLSGGTWGDRLGAARGIELDLRESGRVDLVFADAFAGPAGGQILDLAARFGVSGIGSGRFRVTRVDDVGRGQLVFDKLSADTLTVHPRFGGKFALPAAMFIDPVHQALDAMTGVPFDFSAQVVDGLDELHLRAEIGGVSTLLRLAPPDPDAVVN